MAIGPRILSTSPWSHYMKTVFLGILLSTDIIPPNGSDLISVTRATKSNSGMLSPIPILFITSHFWTCIAQQHNTRSKATTHSQLTSGGKVSPKVISGHDHPKATWLRKLAELWDRGLGLRERVRKTAIILDLLPVLLKAEFGPDQREGEKNIHWIYLPLEWTRQISILTGIAFKSSVDFENNIIAWYHKQFPIFRSSWARLSFSPNSNNSITAAREMELQWTGIHFP